MVDAEFIALQEALAGDYSLEREIGRGGMGIVYLAREVQLERLVAIKVLPGELAARSDLRERFLREARMAARLSHPHIVPIHRVGETGGFVYFAMSYVRGQSLGQRLRERGPLTTEAAVRMIREVAWALAYAHGNGIVHRDVKADNILLEEETGRALVTDFGIARAAADADLTDPGQLMGTAHFMSPEQAAGESLDGRSDLYSLGVVAYLALSGRPPFDAPSAAALLVKHASEPAPPLSIVAPHVPGRVTSVVDRCLQKHPGDRFTTGEELAEALDSAAVARRQLPMPLRVWAQQKDPLRFVYLAWTSVFVMGTIAEGRGPGSDAWVTALFALLPAIPSFVFHARKAQRALRAGYSLADLRATLKEWRVQRQEELSFEMREDSPLFAQILRGLTWGAIGGIGLLALTPLSLPFPTLAARITAVSLGMAAIVGVAACNAYGVPMLGRQARRALEGGPRMAFWNSKLGEWFTRLLGRGRPATAGEIANRPTEIALGIAVDELYDALPRMQKQQLRDLPRTVRELETHAADARRRIDELDAAPMREQARRDLAEAVTVLQSIRLDLLRLHGGTLQDLAPLTTVLERARDLGQQLDALREAASIVSGELRSPTRTQEVL